MAKVEVMVVHTVKSEIEKSVVHNEDGFIDMVHRFKYLTVDIPSQRILNRYITRRMDVATTQHHEFESMCNWI